jgi:hypothetical protein
MSIHRPDGTVLAEIPLCDYSFNYWPAAYCPNCHTDTADAIEGPYIEEESGEAYCYNCAEYLWPDMKAARAEGNWSHVKCTRVVLEPHERERKRLLTGLVTVKVMSFSFFERHDVLSLPRAYKVISPSIQQATPGYFIADPRYLPLLESQNVTIR